MPTVIQDRRARTPGYVYVLHFREALGTERHHARHYIGWARNWTYRVRQHRCGESYARIMRVCFERGIPFSVELVTLGDRHLERRMKNAGHYDRYCRKCGGTAYHDVRI